jgi:CelD/BcsL family acetyltransferase involved in cellulose biosynthesis
MQLDNKLADLEIPHQETFTRSTQVISSIDSLDRLADRWNSLSTKFNSPIQDFNWSQVCAKSICANDKLRIVVSSLGEKVVAIAPLIQPKGMLSPLKMPGVGKLGEPMDFLYADLPALDALAQALKKLGQAINLERIPHNSPVIAALRQAYQGSGLVYISPSGLCPYIPLSEAWTTPEQQFNSGRRSDFRRAQKHAQKLGEVTYEILSPQPAEVAALLAEAYHVESKSWKGKVGSALAIDRTVGDFYRQYALKASQQGILRLCFLRIDGQAIAMQIAVEYDSRFWLLKVGYDETFTRCSAGNLLMLHTVKYAAESGFKSYEFLGTEETWTKVWTELVRSFVSVRIYPASISGVWNFGADAAKSVRAKLTARLTARTPATKVAASDAKSAYAD